MMNCVLTILEMHANSKQFPQSAIITDVIGARVRNPWHKFHAIGMVGNIISLLFS